MVLNWFNTRIGTQTGTSLADRFLEAAAKANAKPNPKKARDQGKAIEAFLAQVDRDVLLFAATQPPDLGGGCAGKTERGRSSQRLDREFGPLVPARSLRQPILVRKGARRLLKRPLLVRKLKIHGGEI